MNDDHCSSLHGKNVTVVGGGVIGASWSALFLAAGLRVTVSDPGKEIVDRVKGYVMTALRDLDTLALNVAGINADNLSSHLHFEPDLAKAVVNADYVQENAPEQVDIKANLWKIIEDNAPAHALFLSSSSGIVSSRQSVNLKRPERLLIGHPFNPPHLLPLVEVVPGEKREEALIQQTMDFYYALGKSPQRVNKEIDGFVANRLQSAIFRECVYLVTQGVVTVDQLDDIVTSSVGIRWSTGGPFLSFHLGGGQGGMTHFLEHLAPGMASRWQKQVKAQVAFDDATNKKILQQVANSYGKKTITELEKQRDTKEIAVIETLKNHRSS